MEGAAEKSREINDLFRAKLGILSDKVTERQKCAYSLLELLERSHVLDYISSHSQPVTVGDKNGRGSKGNRGGGSRTQVTWSTLFVSVESYVWKEVDAIRKLEGKGSTTTMIRKKDTAGLLLGYIRACNKRGHHLPLAEVLEFLIKIMQQGWTKIWAVPDHTHILLTHILSVPQYAIAMPTSTWEALLTLYCDLYVSVPGVDRALMARALSSLLLHCSPQCDVSLNNLYIFYEAALKNISEEKDCKLVEELLTGLCTYFTVAGPNGRSRICSLGEDIFSTLLHLRLRALPSLKNKITELLAVQIRIHHPGGRVREEDGAWFRDEVQWRSGMEKLYNQIMSELESGSSGGGFRLRRSSGWTEEGCGQGFPSLDLTCDVVYLSLHMMDASSPSTHTGTPRAKKRKRQSCWGRMRDGLCSSKDVSSIISWLQLIAWLLAKWNNSLPLSEHLPLLSLLQTLLRERENKRVDCTKWVLLCLYALVWNSATTTHVATPTGQVTDRHVKELLDKVWKSTIKLLTVHCCNKECYLLLTALLQRSLVDPDLGLWQLLHASLHQPTSASVAFLACFLDGHTLPDSAGGTAAGTLSPVMLDGVGCVAWSSYPLRSQLLHFLLPTPRQYCQGGTGVGGGRDAEVHGSVKCPDTGGHSLDQGTSSSVVLLSHVLVALTQRAHGSAHLPFLQTFYQYSSLSAFFHELLDPTFITTHRTRFSSDPFTSSPCDGKDNRNNKSDAWVEVEKVYLQSTFDERLVVPCLESEDSATHTQTFSRETSIGCLQVLLLQLLGRRSEMLLESPEAESSCSARERMQKVGSLCEAQAIHCSLTVHVVLLLCLCEAFTHPDQLRKTLAIKTLPKLLKSIEVSLRHPVWTEVERPHYHQTCGRVLSSLLPLFLSPHLHHYLPPSARRTVLVVRKMTSLSMPDSLQQLILDLAVGKWVVSPSPLATDSMLSLGGSSTSRPRTLSRSTSVDFEDEDDLTLPDSARSTHSDFSDHSSAGPHYLLSMSSLSDRSSCQLRAALFLTHAYINWTLVHASERSDGEVPQGGGAPANFDIAVALLTCLSEQDKSKAINVQMVFKMTQTLCFHLSPVKTELLECMVDVINEILALHRKNQTVYAATLSLLTHLLPHLSRLDSDLDQVRKSFMKLASGFWTLYEDKLLPAAVRLKLVDLLTSLHAADMRGTWTSLMQRRKKKPTATSDSSPVTVRQAMSRMVNDVDHAVRMHVARAVPSLFLSQVRLGDGDRHGDRKAISSVVLLDRSGQEETFNELMASLRLAYFISDGLHELSSEDESVNRVSSRIYSLQLLACVSPVCERKVVSELLLAVKRGHIESDLVDKSLEQVALYLGFGGTRQLLETMLLSLVQDWLAEKFSIIDFPHALMGYASTKSFLEAYSSQLVPHLIFSTDEDSLTVISEVMGQSLPSLLEACLPACMVLILTCWAEAKGKDQRQEQANMAHKLLLKLITEVAIDQTLQLSMDSFVLELLLRLFEPQTCKTHLARFSLPSDPEPPLPHYSSHMIRATLDYMPTCYGSSTTAFLRLLSKRNEHIQHILLVLAIKIEAVHRSFQRRRLLQAYNLFVQLICREVREGGLEATRSFIVMDIIHSMVRIVNKDKPRNEGDTAGSSLAMELFPICADILQTLCLTVLEVCPQQLTPHLHTLITTLTPVARQIHTAQGKQALTLLGDLLDKVPPEAVARLDPFPNSEPFINLRQKQLETCRETGGISLMEKIECFLSGKKKCLQTMAVSGDSLKSLRASLQESQYEIEHALQQGSSNLVLRLLCTLVDTCPTALPSSLASADVARVLGEIGPRDMGCIALPPVKDEEFDIDTLSGSWDSKTQVNLLYHLTMLLLDQDIGVVQASGECLSAVLAGKTMAPVMAKLEEEMEVDSLHWGHYLQPFKPQKRKKYSVSPSPTTNSASFSTLVDVSDLWVPSKEGVASGCNSSHSSWLTRLVMTLLSSDGVTSEVLKLIKPVCKVKVELCEEVFPLIIHDVLQASNNNADLHLILSRQVRQFFHVVSTEPRPSSPTLASSQLPRGSEVAPDSVRTMLSMVMYLRTVPKPKMGHGDGAGTLWDNNFWLDLDFLDIARAAQRCSAYFTSLLYVEIWRGTREQDSPTPRLEEESEVLMIEGAKRSGPSADEVSEVQALLLQAYRHIGEPDSLYGACSSSLTASFSSSSKRSTRLSLYEHEGEWHKALGAHNVLMQLPGASSHVQVAESLHQLGLSHVLKMYLCGVRGVDGGGAGGEDVTEYLYETAWRCTQWGQGSQDVGCGTGTSGYHRSIFNCLMSLKDGEISSLHNSLSEARHCVMQSLVSTGLESTYSLYPSLSKLLCLLEVEEASTARGSSHDHTHSLRDLDFLQDWQKRLPHLNADFKFVEPVLALRASVLRCLLQVGVAEGNGEGGMSAEGRKKVEGVVNALSETLFTQSRWARQASHFQVCEQALFSLKLLHDQRSPLGLSESSFLSPHLDTLTLEEAKLHWERGERTYAMAVLKELLESLRCLHQTCPDRVSTLYPTSLNLYGSWLAETRSESPSEIIANYLELSVNLTEELQISDPNAVMEAHLTLARYADAQYRRIERQMESSAFEAKRLLLKKSKIELQKLATTMTLEEQHKDSHVRTLKKQSEEDELVMANLMEEKQLFLKKALKNYIHCLRTGDTHDLRIFRLCGLWFANSANTATNNLMKDGVLQLESRKFVPLMYQLAARLSSKSLARDLFQQVLQEVIYRCTLEHPYHCLYVILALSNASKDNQFPKSGYVTGKSLNCMSSRMRQKPDSVDEDKVKAARSLLAKLQTQKPSLVQSMEQLCNAYIDVAYYDVSTYKKMRTAIKFPPTCPLLKLDGQVAIPTVDLAVDRTCQYEHVLCLRQFEPFFQLAGGVNLPKIVTCIGSDGKRRKQLIKDIPRGSSKYLTYSEVIKKFRPVFHHFFMENFLSPPQWFERRLTYTRSVAASSIVGYVLGLGDRHIQNILIDKNTAEFIHIDLGVAFEQGKNLPTPETVPFRLTRDVIDGMGVAGVEGVFRRCCEKTMSLLRAHQEELRTIVEVLLHDPLYQWTLSPLKALHLQGRPGNGEDTSTHNAAEIFETSHRSTTSRGQGSDLNKIAERVLIRLQEKLEGIEDGVPLSVSGQVNHLIQEATDPKNLCMLFPGWQPWI